MLSQYSVMFESAPHWKVAEAELNVLEGVGLVIWAPWPAAT